MKMIQLTKGYETIVDDCFYEVLNANKWHFSIGYAIRTQYISRGKKKNIKMHREIIKLSGINLLDTDDIDHKNLNPLDNRLENLRVCTRQANNFNIAPYSKSGYKGVCRDRNNWAARIMKDGKVYNLGVYLSPEAAAQAYNNAAIRLFGDYAWLNPLETRIENLEACRPVSKSGYRGVEKCGNKWRAVLNKDGKRYQLGSFLTAEEASNAYESKVIELYGKPKNIPYNPAGIE